MTALGLFWQLTHLPPERFHLYDLEKKLLKPVLDQILIWLLSAALLLFSFNYLADDDHDAIPDVIEQFCK